MKVPGTGPPGAFVLPAYLPTKTAASVMPASENGFNFMRLSINRFKAKGGEESMAAKKKAPAKKAKKTTKKK